MLSVHRHGNAGAGCVRGGGHLALGMRSCARETRLVGHVNGRAASCHVRIGKTTTKLRKTSAEAASFASRKDAPKTLAFRAKNAHARPNSEILNKAAKKQKSQVAQTSAKAGLCSFPNAPGRQRGTRRKWRIRAEVRIFRW